MSSNQIFTIGHSNHSMENFLKLLNRHGVTAVADIRSAPFSRFCPHFNMGPLRDALISTGIAYIHLGTELGGRPDDPSCHVNGLVCYDSIASTETFSRGLDRVQKGASDNVIALMCSERDPIDCHRSILVGRHLIKRGMRVDHILHNGEIECGVHFLDRLLDECNLSDESLFAKLDREERIDEAYTSRGQKIAYHV